MKVKFIRHLAYITILVIGFKEQNAIAQNYSLYGVTAYGGKYNLGVVFRYDYPSGKDTVILNFNDTDGAVPYSNLIQASDGNLYGTTSEGGTSNDGVFYCINPVTYKDTVLVSFHGTNGANPHNALFQASNLLLYGVTSKGGTYGKGFCYSYDLTTKTETGLFSFDGTNGTTPTGHFLQSVPNGLLYGRTRSGGTHGDGTLFYYNIITGHDSILVNFDNTNGADISGGFMLASNGLIYGTTLKGGDSNYGVLYSFNHVSRTLSVLFSFNGSNGIYPSSDTWALIQSPSGLLYGLTQMGGTYSNGLMYSYNINTLKDSIMLNFTASDTLGDNPYTVGFIQIPGNGALITCMDSGGKYGYGTLMSFDPSLGGYKRLLDFNDTNGAYPTNDMVLIPNEIEENVNSIRFDNGFNLFPNPNNGQFTFVYYSGQNKEPHLIEVYNMLGEKIFAEKYNPSPGGTFVKLNQPSAGIYLYRVTSSDGKEVSTGKFVIE